jgi:hypothetical protein
MVKRYYFHLVDRYDVIPDEVGIEVVNLAQARVEALRAVHEFRQECADTTAASGDWADLGHRRLRSRRLPD